MLWRLETDNAEKKRKRREEWRVSEGAGQNLELASSQAREG